MVMVFSWLRSGGGSNRCGRAGTRSEQTASSDVRTSGSAKSDRDRNGIVFERRSRDKLKVVHWPFLPTPALLNHPKAPVGNPDASRSFVGCDSDQPATHMINPAATARLVPPPGRALSFTSRCLCTTLRAINLAAITVAADEYLGPTACTQKKSGDRSRGGRVWTRATMIGILPRHACSARVGHGVDPRLGG